MSTDLLIELAWKSTLTLGATLLLLRLLRHRSAAERSWLAHAGLLVTLLLPLGFLSMPRWEVAAPAPVAEVLAPAPRVAVERASPAAAPAGSAASPQVSISDVAPPATPDPVAEGFGADTALLAYYGPAAVLLALTLVALVRLFGLKRRASVLVEHNWLSALANAQRRMGFKHGTALLVSPDIASPVSWGVLRPVILLNEAAIASKEQAEAIIAHELAHVARFDWAKLLLARVTAALFWFNPLVWLLTRQCHQLREESADDEVLAHDVPDLDYAELLVGVARHESGALLLAANGVAPSRGSLAQRVTRVLDTSLRRAPARLGWTAGITLGAGLFAAPLAALSLGGTPVESPTSPMRFAAVATAPAAPRAPAAPLAPPAPAAPAAPVVLEDRVELAVATALDKYDFDFEGDIDAAVAVATQVAGTAGVAASAVAQATAEDAPWRTDSVIEVGQFNNLSLQGGGNVVLKYGPKSRVRVLSGDPSALRIAVAGDSLSINGGGGTRDNPLRLEVTVNRLEVVSIHGGGNIVAQGSFPAMNDLALSIYGGGAMDLKAIPSDDVAASIHGGGLIAANARQDLAASIVGGGSIRYVGDPEIATSVRGGGTVSRAN